MESKYVFNFENCQGEFFEEFLLWVKSGFVWEAINKDFINVKKHFLADDLE